MKPIPAEIREQILARVREGKESVAEILNLTPLLGPLNDDF